MVLMRKSVLLLTLFCLADFTHAGQPLARCEAHDETLKSKVLSTNGSEPEVVTYRVYLPKGYERDKKYGVVYFLHGRGANHRMLDELSFCSTLDSEMKNGLRGFIVIAPSGGDSYWMNGAKSGKKWGDLVTSELISQIESRYPVISSPRGRLISGISMGGHGAIQLGLNNPGIYGAVAGHSPVFRTQEEAQKDFPAQFGTGDQYENRDPVSLVRKKGKRLGVPVWIDMGGADPWIQNTRDFGRLLYSVKEDVALGIGSDPNSGHDHHYWGARLPEYIRWYSFQIFGQKGAGRGGG